MDNDTENLTKLFGAKEDLHPDLVPYVDESSILGPMVKHPLVYANLHIIGWQGNTNKLYKYKLEAVEKAEKEGKWGSYVYLHERPYRLQALLKAARMGLTGTAYWNLLSSVWTDTENFWQNSRAWKQLWKHPHLDKEAVMDEDELAKLKSLPDVVDVYRGTNFKKASRGLSWTLNADKAKWFAKRFSHKGKKAYVYHGRVKKADVLAVMLKRGEDEVVAAKVDIVGVTEVE